ncbi:putative glycoside hydrolase [Zoogloea sp. LCSB751]|uniref:putative glycoside hydrolase n=1 Tax=Zoogloea sp. LCSB751 TaxID=1965277 RepID=UPI0009A4927B|nr:putative glycoside hydrolase [Zoogloea sp. LCSB751]
MTNVAKYVLLFLALLLIATEAQTCTGQVVEASSDKPLAGALVTRGKDVLTTGVDGRYAFPGTCAAVAARAIGYRRASVIPPDGESAPPLRLAAIRPKALYLSFWGVGHQGLRQAALELIEQTELNALVIDMKGDRGGVPYPTAVSLAETIGARKITTVADMGKLIAQLREKNVYLIARIVVFKDDPLANAHPEWAVKTATGAVFHDGEELAWIDPSRREAWNYSLDLAVEAARLGFDEIQFDYVRFPDSPGLHFSVANTEENRVAAISGFLTTARSRLLPYNVFLSADIFGYVFWNTNDTLIGQKLEILASHLDYLAPMLYPSGFKFGIPGYTNPVANPKEIVHLTLKHAIARTGISPLRLRPWIQGFRDYAFDHRAFGGPEIRKQIDAADNVGTSGWMLWNPRNAYTADGLGKK